MSRPRVTVKLASSLDGRIALASGESRWITGEAARAEGHRLRASHDSILVGVGTALQDDPALTVRLPDYRGPQPLRVVLDTRLRLPKDSTLVQTAHQVPVLVLCSPVGDQDRRRALESAGVQVVETATSEVGLDPLGVLDALAAAGVGSVMIEGGGRVVGSFLAADAVDRIVWFRAPILIGEDGAASVGALGLEALRHAPTFARTSTRAIGPDLMEEYERS